jgi:hypothetical protein
MSSKFDITNQFENASKMSFGLLLLAWACAFSFLKIENVFWWNGLILSVVFMTTFLIISKYSANFRRAWVFHVMIFLTGLPGFLGVLDVSIRFLAYLPNYQVWKLLLGWTLLFAGMIWQTGFAAKILLENMGEDISTGRISLDKGTWDLEIPSYIDKNQSVWLKIGNVTSPLVVAFAFWSSRNFGQDGYELVALLMYVFMGIGVLGFSRQLAFAMFLRQVEKIKQVSLGISRSA